MNKPLFSLDGDLIGYPDVFDGESATAGEYDGGDHRELDQHTADNIREERFEEYGLQLTRVTSWNLRRPQDTIARLRRAARVGKERCGASPPGVVKRS